MASTALDEHLAAERSSAVRGLLATPLLDAETDREAFRLVVRHGQWLTEYFEQTCGWSVTVDAAAGFARLAKRAVLIDTSRPLRRTRGDAPPFDRRRYQLLCLVCAELVRHPVTTVGLLATAVTADSGLDTSRYGERSAFVDVLRVLASWGMVRVTAGEVDAFVDSEQANAILAADTARLHRLLVSAVAPSALPDGVEVESAIERLSAEPRYGDAITEQPAEAADEARNRWARHRLGRRLLDDPAVYLEDLSPVERDYLASLSGRRWLRERVAEAGFELEERAEGLLAVDPEAIATDARFPAPQGNGYQLALLLADRLVPSGLDGRRRLERLEPDQLRREVAAIMARFPSWARGRREGDGPDRLTAEAVDLLTRFGLARREPDGAVVALPALARYRITDPVVAGEPTLFEEQA
ncbi:MAG: TIGR02678 family protein [Jatrophihabitantaceae bacterium]